MAKPVVHIIGAGFSGLASACILAKEGHEVHVFEKHNIPGGRARNLKLNGFTFDMGPTWYWLPDTFEKFFGHFGKKPSDYYKLVRLNPSYRTYFGKQDYVDLSASLNQIYEQFEALEAGSGEKLKAFLDEASLKYKVGMNKLVYKPGHTPLELVNLKLLKQLVQVKSLQPVSQVINRTFKNDRIRRILEFPVIFLGAKPQNIPAIYTLMNYADMSLGTWYPIGGMYSVIEAMVSLANELGVQLHLGANVEQIGVQNGASAYLEINGEKHPHDALIASADYHFVEQKLLEPKYRTYSESYWNTRQMSPSAILYYIGLKKPVNNLLHHNIFFDTDFTKHSSEIYDTPQWPTDPAVYVSVSTKTDKSGAPRGKENMIVLIPIASGLKDTPEIKQQYFDLSVQRIEKNTGENIRENIEFSQAYSLSDFSKDYNAYKGNAYGLANTLLQTAFLKPKLRNKKVKNMFYAGQLTTPGPGVPPAIISGMVAASELSKVLNP